MFSAQEWNGPVGSAWAAEWQRTDRSFADLSRTIDAAMAARLGHDPARVVDIGCGAGATSMALARACPRARITGVDISPDLIAAATRRAEAITNLDFSAGPAESVVAALAPVDLFVSRHGVMFFPDPVEAFGALRAAAAPGAGLMFSCFRSVNDNGWATILADMGAPPPPAAQGYVPGPFAFADPAFVAALLRKAGWANPTPVPIDFRYRAGEGADPVGDALDFFRHIGPTSRLLASAGDAERPGMIDRLTTTLKDHRHGDIVEFPAAAWLWIATA